MLTYPAACFCMLSQCHAPFQSHGQDAARTYLDSAQLFLLAICFNDAMLNTFCILNFLLFHTRNYGLFPNLMD